MSGFQWRWDSNLLRQSQPGKLMLVHTEDNTPNAFATPLSEERSVESYVVKQLGPVEICCSECRDFAWGYLRRLAYGSAASRSAQWLGDGSVATG